jgi:hypothetical protein
VLRLGEIGRERQVARHQRFLQTHGGVAAA